MDLTYRAGAARLLMLSCNLTGRGVQVYYRLYLMRGGRIRDAIEIHAADDASALAMAERSRGVLPAELWCRGRLVAAFAGSAAA